MKQLFERYEAQRQEVEQILEKSIAIVREQKCPDEDLCAAIGSALQNMRSVYTEITEKLPEKAGGIKAPANASVKEIETLWQESVAVKQNALKAVLSEFIRVYSDEERYLAAIQTQLETARELLAQMEADDKASPDVSVYATFLECVKQDLEENEELSNLLEDEGIEGFNGRAIGGLQKKKYFIRDTEGEEQPSVENVTTATPETEELAEKATEKEPVDEELSEEAQAGEAAGEEPVAEEELEPDVLGYVDTARGRVKVKIEQDTPASSAQPSKYISRAKDRVHAMVFTLNMIMTIHVFPLDKVDEFNNGEGEGMLPQGDLDYLLAHGYLGIIGFTINGEEQKYYAPSSKAYESFKRSTVANYVKQCLGKMKDDYPEPGDLIHLKSWSAVFAYRCKLIVDYMLSRLDQYIIHVFRGDPLTDFPYSPHPDQNGNIVLHCAGVLTKQDADDTVGFVVAHIKNHKDEGDLVIIVDSKEAIQAFNEKTANEDEGIRLAMEFAVVDEPEKRYDITGALIIEADEVQNFEDLKKIAGIENQEAESAETDEELESTDEEESVGDSDAEAGEQDLSDSISPVKPLKNVKTPSRKEFESLMKGMFPVSNMLCRNLGCLQLATEEMIDRFVRDDMGDEEAGKVDLKNILTNLENKGYLASYEFPYKGKNVVAYCHTALLRSCLQKDNYRQVLTAREKHRDKYPIAAFVAQEQVSLQELVGRLEKAETISLMFDYQSEMAEIIKNMFCWWYEDKGYHTDKVTMQDLNVLNTVIVPRFVGQDQIAFPSASEDLLIVDMTGGLPNPESLPDSNGRKVYCINETWLYKLIDGAWIKYEDKAEEDEGTAAPVEEAQDESEELEQEEEATEEVSESQGIESEEKPVSEEKAPEEEPSEEKTETGLQDLQNAVWPLFSKGRFYAGMTLLHSLEIEDEAYHSMVERYGFALGDPYLEQDNRFANLQAVYKEPFGRDVKYDLLAYAAYLRMYCSPTAAFDPYSIKDISYLKDNLACGTFMPLNNLLNDMAHYVGRFQHGLDDRTVDAAVLKKTELDRIPEYARTAKRIQDMKLYKQTRANRRVSRTRWQLFSDSSEIQAMLTIVAEDRRSDVKKVKAFLKEKGIVGIVEDDVIDLVMDSAWDDNADAAEKRKTESLIGVERSCMKRQLRDIFECLNEWAEEVDHGDRAKSSETQDTLNLIQKCLFNLNAALLEIQRKPIIQLPPEEAASYVVLEKTVAVIKDRLEGNSTQEQYKRNFYMDLLKAPYVALDEERMPVIESKEEQIYDLDFCKRVAQYVDVPDRSWPDVVKKIFTYSQDRKCFNFGCVEIIRQYLVEIGQGDQFGEYNTQKTIVGLSSPIREKQSPNKWREDYIARFEMAKSDDWFDLETIRSIEERIKAQEEIYYNANNFGIYGCALLRMIDYFNELARKKKPELQHRLDMLKEKYEELESWSIFRIIQESIDKLRFGVADSYLVQAERGSFDIDESIQQPESKLFEEFLTKYNTYYEQAKPESGLTLEKVFTQTHPTVSTEDYKTAVTFLKYWPQKDRPSATNMDAILRSIGQEKMLDKVNYKTKEGFFIATFDEKQEKSITHPIAKYGSVMYEKGLQIAVVKGSSDLVDLVDDISAELRKMNKDIPALIIVDGAVHLDVRRQLAYQFMSKPITQVTFIILDRVLALHIANEKKATRWLRLLNCSVPFQPINPYSDDPTKEIPNEMFFGRADELKKILETETAMLVFGGRQLGKTALLHHARNLSRDMRQGHWASYVDVKDKKVSEAATKIGDTLVTNQREKFFVGTKRTNWTWNILINAIRDRLFVGDDCKDQFFLFIDETDAFLKDSAKHNYRELDDLLQLSTDTNYRFRFVLAGLRDVVQFHREANANNSIVSKFKRLRIPPLEFKDARDLLVIPLSYLGFTFSDDEGEIIAQILHQTNYFPGIIHFYVHKLIEQKHKAFNSSLAPSFRLERNDLLLLLKDKEFRDLRKNRLEITLELDDKDKYYYTLALLLSYFNNNEKPEGKGEDYCQYGVTAQGLLKCARGIDPTAKISKLTESQIITVLEELYELYILKKTQDEDGIEYYDFARTAFADMLGRKDEVQTKLINLMAEGGHEDE